MEVKANKRVNTIIPFGVTGALAAHTFTQKFRTFSVYNNSGSCVITLREGNVMTIPVGITVNFDAATEGNNTVNKFMTRSFTVEADDCVVIGTI